ncbi:hypothetical protein B0H10DRAFT_1943670 [Mycena sp. CBHHK59/15]|nr:hypothetical protein B0H10DRAFT_1943670 [Mycena sp. CBHHK59/15]
MDDSARYTCATFVSASVLSIDICHGLSLACPYHWYCNQHIWHSADDVNDHLTVTHAGAYHLSWASIAGRSQMKVSRGKDGFLKCKWKGCSSSVTGSINSLLNHLKIEHNVEATDEAKNVPTLPWPPVNADEIFKWGPKRRPKAVRVEFPPSQSQVAGIRTGHVTELITAYEHIQPSKQAESGAETPTAASAGVQAGLPGDWSIEEFMA